MSKNPQTQENIIFILDQIKNSTMNLKKKSSDLAIKKEDYPNFLGNASDWRSRKPSRISQNTVFHYH